jgi:pimeloyl-ACP methyl ester carboxylesterase
VTERPFSRGRFRDLPEKPPRPHRFFDTEPIDIVVDSALGRTRVHVRKHGSGPPLLLLHGLMTSSYSWRYAFDGLGERYTCYAPDLPANGRSARPMERAYTPEALADWIAAVQRALGIRGERVVANSMGGYLAMVLALRDRGAMSRLVNLHSPGVPEPRLYALKTALQIPGSRRLLRAVIRRRPLEWAHRNVHYYDESVKSLEEAREYGELLGDRDGADGLIKYLAETMDVRAMRRFRAELAGRRDRGELFPVPLLLVYAERDPMVPPRIGQKLAELVPDARLVWLERASHFAHVDAVDRFLPPVLEFLADGMNPG